MFYSIISTKNKELRQQFDDRFDGGQASLVRVDENTSLAYQGRIIVESGNEEIVIYDGEVCKEKSTCRGNKIVISKVAREIYIENDIYGATPLYYEVNSEFIAVSSNISLLKKLFVSDVDYTGVYQFLCGGYTVGTRTLCNTIKQLLPNERIIIHYNDIHRCAKGAVEESVWSTDTTQPVDENIVAELVDNWLKECDGMHGGQVMFSAGWDSRLILMGLMAGKVADVHAYTHGDIRSREIRLAAKMARESNIDYETVPINEQIFNEDFIENVLDEVENCIFPHWAHAAKLAKQRGAKYLTAGTFGAVLGGHYGTTCLYRRGEGMKVLLKYLLKIQHHYDDRNSLSKAQLLIKPKNYINFWCLKDEFNKDMGGTINKANNDDIDSRLYEFYQSGIVDTERLVEAFLTEHRGRQYINAQLTTARAYVNTWNPFTNPQIVRTASRTPMVDKIHNSLHRKMLIHMNSKLLGFPMAATLINARNPIIFQEFSRGVRKFAENNFSKYIGPLGWPNYAFLENSNLLNNICEGLTLDIWDKNTIRKVIKNTTGAKCHSLFDMMMKIKTIDYRLKGLD